METKSMLIGVCAAAALSCSSEYGGPPAFDAVDEAPSAAHTLGVQEDPSQAPARWTVPKLQDALDTDHMKLVVNDDLHVRMLVSVLPRTSRRTAPLYSGISWLVMRERPAKRCSVHYANAHCSIRDCRAEFGSLPHADSGVITVDGKTSEPVVLEPLESGAYLPWQSPPVFTDYERWHAGESVRVASTGGRVPPFSVQGEFPGGLALELPNLDRPLAFDRHVPLEVAWKPVNESVVVAISQAPVRRGGYWAAHEVACTFPGKPGRGVVPTELLRRLAPTTDEHRLASTFFAGHATLRKVETEGVDLEVYFARFEWQDAMLF